MFDICNFDKIDSHAVDAAYRNVTDRMSVRHDQHIAMLQDRSHPLNNSDIQQYHTEMGQLGQEQGRLRELRREMRELEAWEKDKERFWRSRQPLKVIR
jgi:hypothetical protein